MSISSKLKELRISNGYSINRVAKEAGVAQSYISDIESGKSNPTIEKLEKIVKIYNIELSDFFSNTSDFVDVDTQKLIINIRGLPKDKIDLLNKLIEAMK